MTADYKHKTLGIGRTCCYYHAGNLNRKPYAALVTDSDSEGILDLTIFGPNARNLRTESGVRHKDDPYLEARPVHRTENGVWDYLEEQVSVPSVPDSVKCRDARARPPAGNEQDAKMNQMGSDELLLHLYGKHGDNESKRIAKEMTGRTGEAWNYQRVNVRLRGLLKREKMAAEAEPEAEPEPETETKTKAVGTQG